MREKFWELPLDQLDQKEWEALCDRCGKCCLNKLQYEDTNEVVFTRVACKLLDLETGQCSSYPNRHDFVPGCVVLSPKTIAEIGYWLPKTCAYRLRFEGRPLPDWHPLLTGDRSRMRKKGITICRSAVPASQVPRRKRDQHIIKVKNI